MDIGLPKMQLLVLSLQTLQVLLVYQARPSPGGWID